MRFAARAARRVSAMLSEAIRGLLAPALAVALSPIPIIAIVLVLASQKARSNGPAFALGWTGGLAAVSTVVVLVLGDAERSEGGSSTAANWFMVGLGAVLVVLAAKQWRTRPPKGEAAEMPSWMATVDTMAPRRSLALGVALSAANPKNLVLTLAASAAIAGADLDPVGAAAAIGVFVGIGSASVVGAVLYFLVDAERAGRGLDRVKRFMARHSALIMTVILLVLGAKLVLDGVSGLWG